jgi:trans-2,3-dihydro-3-hydroxyanthranilate isomerase
MQFYLVDVFAEAKYQGNQLPVFIGNPPSEQMQTIALEMNYSETTFVTSTTPENGGYNVRIFMPTVEAPFAGHPTLGTAYIIREYIIKKPVQQVNLNLKVGQIPVTFSEDGVAWMRQNQPEFMQTYDVDTWAKVLNLSPDDFDADYPIQDVSTGLPFTITPLKTLAAVKRARVNLDRMREVLADSDSLGPLIFSRETYHAQSDLNARVLVDVHGIPEDPATGSANGNLSSYLVKYNYFGRDHIQIKVEQGYEINRPSLLYHNTWQDSDEIAVNIGGRVFIVAEGRLVD